MKKLSLLFAALLIIDAGAQTAPASTPAGKARAGNPSAGRAGAKAVLPDPEILDGSKYEPEKRPLYGMLSEIEMGEEEGGQPDRVSPNSGPAGQPSPDGQQQAGGGGSQPPPPQQEGGAAGKIAEGPQAQPEGIQVQNLQVPPGAQAGQQGGPQSGPQGGARNMQIGDATLQIQTVPNTPDMVGAQQASNAQQYEKKVPAGQQTNNRNQGVEKGKVMPKGL